MKFAHICLFMFLLAPAMAWAAPATDASLKELMEVSEMRKLADTIPAQVSSSMDVLVQQTLQGKEPTQRQQQAIDTMKKRFSALMAAEFSYEKLEAQYLPLYRETFSDEEVAGLIAFYKTPAGQAVIHKMPTLMTNIMQMQQKILMPLMPKVQEIANSFANEMKEASARK